MSEALDTIKSVAKAGLAVASNRPAANADKEWRNLRRDEEEKIDIGELALEVVDSINNQGHGWGNLYKVLGEV